MHRIFLIFCVKFQHNKGLELAQMIFWDDLEPGLHQDFSQKILKIDMKWGFVDFTGNWSMI